MPKSDKRVVTVGDVKHVVEAALDDFAKIMLRQFERIEKRFQDLELSRREDWREQREWNRRMEKKVDMLDDSVRELNDRVKDVEKREFTLYNHERRITTLEKKVR